VQADAFARKYPDMRIASMRYHWVVEPSLLSADALHRRGGEPKDLWGYISEADTAEATLLGLTAPEQTFPAGHEAFFVVAPTQHQQASTAALIDQWYPHSTRRKQWRGNEGLFDCGKAEKLLGWTAKVSFPWTAPAS
jgi:nucleoside-diphosphate-sugar epimerase